MKKYTWKSSQTKNAYAFNSGGNVMLDIIELNSGEALVISDECVCRYDSIHKFHNSFGDHNFDKNCFDLADLDIPSTVRETCYFCKRSWGFCECRIDIKHFEWNDMTITDPLVDSSGRFFVNPFEYYGDAFTAALED